MRAASVSLTRRQLFMLPTRHGLLFALVLLVLFLAAVNYSNGLAYLLVFLLAAMAIVSMFYTHRNLLHLRIGPGSCPPVFAGQDAQVGVCLYNDGARARLGVGIKQTKTFVARVDLPALQSLCIDLTVPTQQRGYVYAPSFIVYTRYPLGLLRSWSRRIELDLRCLVYPRPGPSRPLVTTGESQGSQLTGTGTGDDDFIGLRGFYPGDSPRHVHWKAVARGQGMYTKQFGGADGGLVWLDWDALPGMDTEARLSQLCRWVLDAEQTETHYGLRLPHQTITPARGSQHQHRCLAALALFHD